MLFYAWQENAKWMQAMALAYCLASNKKNERIETGQQQFAFLLHKSFSYFFSYTHKALLLFFHGYFNTEWKKKEMKNPR